MSSYTLSQMLEVLDPSCFPPSAVDKTKVTLLNKVRQSFYDAPDQGGTLWKGGQVALAVNVVTQPDDEQTITLPRHAETLLGVYDSGGIQRIRNQWFSFLRVAPTTPTGGRHLDDLGDGWCGALDFPGTGSTIKVTTTEAEPQGLSVKFYGTDSDGNPISEELTFPVDTAEGDYQVTSSTFYSVERVVCSVTCADILVHLTYTEATEVISGGIASTVFGCVINGGTASTTYTEGPFSTVADTFYARYEPGETSPNYRRYRLSDATDDDVIFCLCKRRYYPLLADNDPMDIDNVLAIECGLKAYRYLQNADPKTYKGMMIEAIGYLVKDGKVSKYLPKKAIAESVISVAKSTMVRKLYEN